MPPAGCLRASRTIYGCGAAALIFAALTTCQSFKPESVAPIQPNDVYGAWVLKTINGLPPSNLQIKDWRIDFLTNQHWTYSGEMTGHFTGMKLSGEGSWRIQSDSSGSLEYTAGENSGRSTITLRNGLLRLSPDPVIVQDGKNPVTTTYKRAQPPL